MLIFLSIYAVIGLLCTGLHLGYIDTDTDYSNLICGSVLMRCVLIFFIWPLFVGYTAGKFIGGKGA